MLEFLSRKYSERIFKKTFKIRSEYTVSVTCTFCKCQVIYNVVCRHVLHGVQLCFVESKRMYSILKVTLCKSRTYTTNCLSSGVAPRQCYFHNTSQLTTLPSEICRESKSSRSSWSHFCGEWLMRYSSCTKGPALAPK